MTRNRTIRIRGGGAVRARGGLGAAVLAAAWIVVVLALIGLVFWIRAQPDPGGAGRQVVLTLPPASTERTEQLMPPAAQAAPEAPAAGAPAPETGATAAAAAAAAADDAAPLPPTRAPDGSIVALAPAPDPSLVASTARGPLPVVGPTGRRAWRAYARPFQAPPGATARVAVVVAGLGMSEAVTTAAIERLPGAVTLSFVSYTRDLQGTVARARAAGHEALIEVPMEPYDYPQNDPGPSTLRTDLPPTQNVALLEAMLARASGYIGAMNYLGAKFTATPAALAPVLQVLNARGLMFFDSHAFATESVRNVAHQVGIPFASSDLTIDERHAKAAVDGQLAKLVALARQTGRAIGVGGAYPATVDQVSAWVATLPQQGVVLAPLSALLPMPAPGPAAQPAAAAPAPAEPPHAEAPDGH